MGSGTLATLCCSTLRDTLALGCEIKNDLGWSNARQVEIFLFGSFCVEHLRDGWGRALWQHCVAARCATRLRQPARTRTSAADRKLNRNFPKGIFHGYPLRSVQACMRQLGIIAARSATRRRATLLGEAEKCDFNSLLCWKYMAQRFCTLLAG